MKQLTQFLMAGLLILAIGCNQAPTETAQPEAPAFSTQESKAVIDRHLKAFMENDMEGMLADYAEDVVFVGPDGTLKGVEELRVMFNELFTIFPAGQIEIEADKLVVEGDMVYLLWHGSSPSVKVSMATDTFIIRNGKIIRQSYAAVMEPVVAEESEDAEG